MKSSKPTILIITRNLPPLVGGMEQMSYNCMVNGIKLHD